MMTRSVRQTRGLPRECDSPRRSASKDSVLTRPKVSERQEQSAIVQLLEAIGGKVYVLGTVRRKGDHPGTMQTPGICDLLAFLPSPPRGDWTEAGAAVLVCVEVKARGGRLRKEQREFAEYCADAAIPHVVGGVDVVIQWATEAGYVVR